VTRTSDFPTLRVLEDRFEADGAFAQAQAQYLRPDPDAVRALDALLAERRIGVVAHYYMDPELQGVLASLHLAAHVDHQRLAPDGRPAR
jgi:quinolinate synthase